MGDVKCPYCGADVEINHDDGYGYEEDKIYNQECPACHKTFIFTTSISFYYDVEKADCLNGAEHQWEVTGAYPEFARKMRCKVCDEKREPTPEERKAHNIPTYKEWEKANTKGNLQ